MTGGDERIESASPHGQPTPEFLVWAIEFQCPLRDIEGFEQPERTERQLRAARAVSDARHAGRIVDGFCIANRAAELAIPSHAAASVDTSLSDEIRRQLPMAFAVDDALALYGGANVVRANCPACPANAERAIDPHAWCGCYGILPLPDPIEAFHSAFDRAMAAYYPPPRAFPLTQPTWYGVWLASPVGAEQSAALGTVVAAVREQYDLPALAALQRALSISRQNHLPLHGQLFPAGSVEGRWWRQSPHCPRCRATWPAPTTYCTVCHWTGKTGTPQKRRARGTRPYRPMEEIRPPS
jgi:hypothetical protein